jgi:hypothetical protein
MDETKWLFGIGAVIAFVISAFLAADHQVYEAGGFAGMGLGGVLVVWSSFRDDKRNAKRP